MSKTYHHLNSAERWQIYGLKGSGKSIRAIALQLDRSASTIASELKLGRGRDGKYRPKTAEHCYQRSRRWSGTKRLKLTGALWRQTRSCLLHRWSPEQTSGRLALNGIMVSHTTIYKRIWKERDPSVLRCLRHSGKRYRRRGLAGRSSIPNRVDISLRPAIVLEKKRLGDWEGDTIVSGKDGSGAIVSLVDRASKLTKLIRVEAKTAKLVNKAILQALKPIKSHVHTITFDNGTEFAGHQKLARILSCQAYFATPYHSWERGLNEHTNGLVRQFFPKSTNFRLIPDTQVKIVENLLNNRPRKCLNFKTPIEAFHPLQTSP